MTTEACIPGKRKSPRRAIELRAKIKELSRSGNSPIEIGRILGKTKQAVYLHLNNILNDGELDANETSYTRAGPREQTKWYKIIQRTLEELPFYEQQGLVPTLRKMYYRLIELGVMEKSKSNYDRFARESAEARKGVDSTYEHTTTLPRLPIHCFRDDNRETIGEDYDDSEPEDPTPAEAPQDWEEYIDAEIQSVKNAYRHLSYAPDNYDGECTEGEKGIDPGLWFGQPIYCEVWCESETIQPDLVKYQDDLKVKVAAMRGFPSTPFVYQSCMRLKQIAESHDYIEKIIILYFGDSDEAGKKIAGNVEAGLNWYGSGDGVFGMFGGGGSEDLQIPVEVELRHIAITPEQVKKYKLTGYQLEAFMTTEARLKIFKKILNDAIEECWDEDIWEENRPPEKYDYEANKMEEPQDVDINDYPEYPDDGEEDLSIGQIMEKRIKEAKENVAEWDNDI